MTRSREEERGLFRLPTKTGRDAKNILTHVYNAVLADFHMDDGDYPTYKSVMGLNWDVRQLLVCLSSSIRTRETENEKGENGNEAL